MLEKKSRLLRLMLSWLGLCLLFAAPVSAQQIITVPLAANALAYDPISRKLYAAVGSREQGAQSNTITVIDPITGSVGKSVFVGSDPTALLFSDQSKYLYVAVNEGRTIRRVDLPTLTSGPTFPVGDGLALSTFAPIAGQPDAILMMRQRPGVSPNDEGVAVYENGVVASNIGHAGHQLATGLIANRFYGYESQISSWDYSILDVHAGEIRRVGQSNTAITGYVGIAGSANGLLLTDDGNVIDPEARRPVGKLAVAGFNSHLSVDAATAKAYMIAGDKGKYALTAFDLRDYRTLGKIPLYVPNGGKVGKAIPCGSNTLAFSVGNQVVLLHGALGSPLPAVDLSIQRSAFAATLASNGTVSYTLTVTNRSSRAASAVFVTDALPKTAEVTSIKTSQGTGLAVKNIIEAQLGPIAGGGTATLEITIRLNAPDEFSFTAVVRGQDPDPVPANNIAAFVLIPPRALLPDLVGEWVSLRQIVTGAGSSRRVRLFGSFNVRNDGVIGSGASLLRFYLSKSLLLTQDNGLPLQEGVIASLPPRRSMRVNLDILLNPGDDATGCFVYAVLDAGNDVAETNKQNNIVRQRVP